MAFHDLDRLLMVLENPIRRQILAKLATETHYALQLSRELTVSQQAIMKHLRVLEDYGMVTCQETPSNSGGPPRKCYLLNQNFTIRIDCGPNTFTTEFIDLDGIEEKEAEGHHKIEEDFGRITNLDNPRESFVHLVQLLHDLDEQIEHLERNRNYLVKLREQVRSQTNKLLENLCDDYQYRKILHFMLDNSGCTKAHISEMLNIRMKVLDQILNDLAVQQLLFQLL